MIATSCPHCRSAFKARDEFAGRQARCPKCHRPLEVPRPPSEREADGAVRGEPSTPPKDLNTLKQQIRAAFRGKIEPVSVPFSYRIGVMLVAALVIALPLAYLAVIGVALYLIYWRALHAASAAVYVPSLAAGTVMIFFLLKPIFAAPGRQRRTRSLTRESDPLLFAFVDQVCTAVGSPQPRRIDVDFEVNASAEFSDGWRGLWSRDLVLTIGVPLVVGLDLRQFAGVLGHEFGHFSQGAAMRLSYLIRTVNLWFARAVYERDTWDEMLVERAQATPLWMSWAFRLALLFVWMTRGVLWLLMIAAQAVSGFLLRQMELDADRHEARLVGSQTLVSRIRQLMAVQVATQGAHADMGEFYREGRLGDDLPQLIASNLARIDDDVRTEIDEIIARTPTSPFDSHPSDRDRIAAAEREKAPGLFHLDWPVSVLFRDFTALSKAVTRDYYQSLFGPSFRPDDVCPVDELLSRQDRDAEAALAADLFFLGAFDSLRPVRLPAVPGAGNDASALIANLQRARQQMLATIDDYRKALDSFRRADRLQAEAGRNSVLVRAGLMSEACDAAQADRPTARERAESARARKDELKEALGTFETAAAARLSLALGLVESPTLADRLRDAPSWQAEVARLRPALELMNRWHSELVELRDEHRRLSSLLDHREGREADSSVAGAVQRQMEKLYPLIVHLRHELDQVPYPFEHARGKLSIGKYAIVDLPGQGDLAMIYGASQRVLGCLPPLYGRIVGSLAMICERVESAVGLEVLRLSPDLPAEEVE